MKCELYRYYRRDTQSHENWPLVYKYLKQLRAKGLGLWTV